VSQDT